MHVRRLEQSQQRFKKKGHLFSLRNLFFEKNLFRSGGQNNGETGCCNGPQKHPCSGNGTNTCCNN